jgi:hypothetical protein
MIDPKQMQAIVDDIVELSDELRRINELDQRGLRRPAASSAALANLQRRFPGKVPPAFVQLLSIYDGVDNFNYVDLSIFGVDYLLSNAAALEEEWVDAGKFAAGEIFVFARSDMDSIATAFLVQQVRADGEFRVVYFDARGIVGEYDDLEHYLTACKQALEHNLARDAADRADFDPDD